MNHLKYILGCAALSATMLSFEPAQAQTTLPDGSYPSIVAPSKQTVSFRERTLCFDVTANVPFTATCDASWVSIRKTDKGEVYVHLKANSESAARSAVITFANADNALSETLTITQSRNELTPEFKADTKIKVWKAEANSYQPGEDISKSIDGDFKTMFHTAWSGFDVSENNPAILTYRFNDAPHIDYINYSTRQDGNGNGNFGKVELYVMTGTETTYRLLKAFDLGQAAGTHRINLTADGLDDVKSVQFKVLSGGHDNASCSEMQFFVDNNKTTGHAYGVFTDGSYTALREGVTQADIDAIDDDFTNSLAQRIFDKTYDEKGRVGEYAAKLSYKTQSDLWNAPGKYYDQTQGVTGINITKGKHVIAVSGLGDDESLPISIVAWYVGKVGDSFNGGNPESQDFTLRNGLNVINYTNNYDGLAYVCYYATLNPELKPKVKVHFIDGQVNGFLSLDKTNEEMHELCRVAPNMCMDVVGTNAHSVWTSRGVQGTFKATKDGKDYNIKLNTQGLYGNCVAVDGKSLGYRQFIHVLDSLVIWEHELLGFHKYNSAPDNRTMAYVNFTYYMFQGGRGVSFHADQEPRVLNCKKLITGDDDAIWGLSHEWGHQHQMHPYFCWGGMGEVTNNMNSYYNIMRMGYRSSDKINQWAPARKHFVKANYSNINRNSSMRRLAYENSSQQNNAALRAYCQANKDSVIADYATNPERALAINEVGVGETLCPFIMLYNYFTTHGCPDFAPDWYESLRQNDNENGSQIEKKGDVDKYELIASAQNSNKNNKYSVLKAKYPSSVWIKKNYVTASSNSRENSVPFVLNYIRKTSRLSGYNLIPYFERWGFLRQAPLYIGDYGNYFFVLTPEMFAEFKADMQELVDKGEIKTMPEGMVEEISNSPEMFQTRPTFPN